jgi:hypothetical protein
MKNLSARERLHYNGLSQPVGRAAQHESNPRSRRRKSSSNFEQQLLQDRLLEIIEAD